MFRGHGSDRSNEIHAADFRQKLEELNAGSAFRFAPAHGNAAAVPVAQSFKLAIVRCAGERLQALPLGIRRRQNAARLA